MFKAHRDTPYGATHFGSLVISLPWTHTGGGLLLRHQGREHTWSSADPQATGAPTAGAASAEGGAGASAGTSAAGGRTDGQQQLHWCAFFSDVEHEVGILCD